MKNSLIPSAFDKIKGVIRQKHLNLVAAVQKQQMWLL